MSSHRSERVARRRQGSRVLLFGLAVLMLTAGGVVAQALLPAEMHPKFSEFTNYAERMIVSQPGSTDFVRIDIRFESQDEQVVTLGWRAQAAGATSYLTESRHEVSFLPTAVARQAGSSRVFYVVGWWAATSRVLVERWEIQTFAVGQVAMPSAPPRTTMTVPRLRRDLIWVSNFATVNPVWDAAVLPYSHELWMLESGPVTRIHSLDLQLPSTSTVVAASDATGMGQLEGMRSFAVGRHPVAGFVVMASWRRPWISGQGLDGSSPMFVTIDGDCDGVRETTTFAEYGQYNDLFPPPWDLDYLAP